MKKKVCNIKSFPYIAFLFIMIITVSSCGLEIVPENDQNNYSSLKVSDKLSSIEFVYTDFSVQVPYPLEEGESLYLEILDEITGLDENFTRHLLVANDNNKYSASIPLILNSEIKYRYVKIGETDSIEITARNSPVRYRMALISENNVINDIIATWSDHPYEGSSGKLLGTVLDSKSDLGVPDILISVAGYQTITDMSGNFVIDGIHPGIHNLVAYAIDGSYQTFQQGTNIFGGLSTQAKIELSPLPEVTLSFIVTPPNDAIGAPIRFAGNFYQLGNTFSDLSNGMSSLSSRMPLLIKMEDGRYGISLNLHAGNFLEYKYTLGDGVTNAERDLSGGYIVRKLIVPKTNATLEDLIVTWRIDKTEPIPIKVTVPANTPVFDSISMQLNTGFWHQPIPMWPMGNNNWFYLLYSPKPNESEQFQVRFCRNDQCEIAYDLQNQLDPFVLTSSSSEINIDLNQWINWDQTKSYEINTQNEFNVRDIGFLTGFELLSSYHPSYQNLFKNVYTDLLNVDANLVILTPTWNIDSQSNSPHFEPLAGKSPLMHDLEEMILSAQALGFNVALFPQLVLDNDHSTWWNNEVKDALWWQGWYSEYERFITNYVQLASMLNVDKLIIGGDFISNTLPNALPKTEFSEGTPSNASYLWRNLIKTIHTTFNGEVIWALPFNNEELNPPDFVSDLDGIYILFDKNISNGSYYENSYTYKINAESIVDTELYTLYSQFHKPIYVGISYPSADGTATACVMNTSSECHNSLLISPFDKELFAEIDLQAQADIYNALLDVFSKRDWINGIVSRGFFMPVKQTDISSSVYGKPAMDVLKFWYSNTK